ncbi:ABC transporter ATP-binding protein [Patulibacter defluvii]|uniref:ABC transporter ATP-binding protein n=1 Tax=Patulibacter defluvii TaxID=3095358 RepID=UPI002A748463|nr:ABC transporter ATP-binding protein [Patulibacter sp. DM4]
MLEISDLRTEFHTRRGVVHAVNGVSFGVPEGRLIGVVGESGCGKSVTVRSLIGLVRPPGKVVGGTATFQGRDLLAMHQRERRKLLGAGIGFVGQQPFASLNPVLSIEKQFANLIRAHRPRTSRAEIRALTLSKLSDTGIAGPERVLEGYAHQLSGGMAQRVLIAMAMALDPALVIADEPTTALDVTVQRQILDLIRQMLAGGERSMLLVTHDLGVVAHYCDAVVVMYAGKVVEKGAVRDVFRNPAHPYTAALLRAVPRPDRRIQGLRGTLPDLVDYPVGCPYAARCDSVTDRCLTEAPAATEVRQRDVACHHPVQEGAAYVAAQN